MIRYLNSRLALPSLTVLGALAFTSSVSAATVTGTFNDAGQIAYSYVLTDLKYEDGTPYSLDSALLICLTAWADAPEAGTVQTLEAGAGSSTLTGGGGALGVAGIHYLVDNFYEEYFINGSGYDQWAFQQALWEFGGDFDQSSLDSFDATIGYGQPGYYYDGVAEYTHAWEAIYADLGSILPTLNTDYKSAKYNIDFFYGLDSDIQNFVSIQDNNLAPIPVPAGLPLVLSGLGALGFLGRKKRA